MKKIDLKFFDCVLKKSYILGEIIINQIETKIMLDHY